MSIGVLVNGSNGREVAQYVIPGERAHIGRSHADINLADDTVSREHATIERRAGGWLLTDLNSRNGTRVNGAAIVRRLLQDGDHVAFGGVELVFQVIEADAVSASSERAAPPADVHGGPVPPCDATSYLPRHADAASGSIQSINALAVLRRMAEGVDHDMEEPLRQILADLQGLLGVHRAVLRINVPGVSWGDRWFKVGAVQSRCGVLFPEAIMEGVKESGKPVAKCGGKVVKPAPGIDCDSICLPIVARGRPLGFLYCEGTEILPRDAIEAVLAISEGLSLGLRLCLPMDRPPRTTENGAVAAIIGRSQTLQKAVAMAIRAARSDATVLISGESGTGKELFARLVHDESSRRAESFVPVHCSAVEETLLGSALFGHEKGAFTGAIGTKKGYFEEADKGTIFFDEIGELSLDMQVKLLRVLQEREVVRIGSTKGIHVDVRVIAATNRDLDRAMREGAFRQDLYYRLKVIPLQLPPLRARPEDIPDLARHFLEQFRKLTVSSVTQISASGLRALSAYDWPGNVRELRNVIERSVVLAEGPEVTADDLPAELVAACPANRAVPAATAKTDMRLDAAERQHILSVLLECGGNKRLAAQRLGISRSTLYEKLKAAAPSPAGP